MLNASELVAGLMALYPDAVPNVDYRLDMTEDGPVVAVWNLPDPLPEEDAIREAAAPVLERQARREALQADLTTAEQRLDERVAMYNRLRATRASTAEIGEVQDEIEELLDYITEVKNAIAKTA